MTVKHRSSTLLWAVLPDILVCAGLLLHIDHLQFVGIITYNDMKYIRPCRNYSELHDIQVDQSFDDIKAKKLEVEPGGYCPPCCHTRSLNSRFMSRMTGIL